MVVSPPLPWAKERKRKILFILFHPLLTENSKEGGRRKEFLLHVWFGRGLGGRLAMHVTRLRYVWYYSLRFMYILSCKFEIYLAMVQILLIDGDDIRPWMLHSWLVFWCLWWWGMKMVDFECLIKRMHELLLNNGRM